MFKKKCKCSTCLFKQPRFNLCSLDKRCYMLCKSQLSEKTLNLRDLRIMCSTQKLIEKSNSLDTSYISFLKDSFYGSFEK